jgi:hypothetical protein
MALALSVRGTFSRNLAALRGRNLTFAFPFLWAGLLTLLIAGPWLGPGYIFGTDWPGPTRFDPPRALSSWAPLQLVLGAISWITSGEIAGKVLILTVMFVAGVSAYRAVVDGGFVARASASTLYLVNPFVYGRLHYGQLFVLAGYAAFPFAATRLRLLLSDPRMSTASLAALGLSLLGVLSPHLLLVSGVLAAAVLVPHAIAFRRNMAHISRLTSSLLVTAGLTFIASSYWIIPLLIGRGPEGTTISAIGTGDLAAFAAIPDRNLGLLPNLLGLYGFWAEGSGRFASMKDFVPFWVSILIVLLLIGAFGAIVAFKRAPAQLGPWVAGLILAAAIGLLLEIGISNPVTSEPVTWLDAHFPLYRGMRDAGKWATLLALVYSQLVGLGAAAILADIRLRIKDPGRADWVGGAAAALLLALPIYYGNGLMFGAHGEIKPSQYPAGWYVADRILASDPHPDRTLFLPWHEYMSFGFIRNVDNVVAPPGPTFFSVPVLVSSNPEVRGVVAPNNREETAIAGLVQAGDAGQWASDLAALRVKYILVAHEFDWGSYMFLDRQPGLVKIGDYGSISLYRDNMT